MITNMIKCRVATAPHFGQGGYPSHFLSCFGSRGIVRTSFTPIRELPRPRSPQPSVDPDLDSTLTLFSTQGGKAVPW